MHLAAGAGVAFIATILLASTAWGLLLATLAGGAKEAFDYFHPEDHTVDPWGFAATVVGGLAPAFVTWATIGHFLYW